MTKKVSMALVEMSGIMLCLICQTNSLPPESSLPFGEVVYSMWQLMGLKIHALVYLSETESFV